MKSVGASDQSFTCGGSFILLPVGARTDASQYGSKRRGPM